MAKSKGWLTLLVALAALVLLIVGAVIGVQEDLNVDGNGARIIEPPDPGSGYTWPGDKCSNYLKAKEDSVDQSETIELKKQCTDDCVGLLNYSARMADQYWSDTATARALWSALALFMGLALGITAIYVARRRPPVWRPVYFVALAFSVAQICAFLGVAVHERWIQTGPADLRAAAAPIISMNWDATLWGEQEGFGACKSVLRELDTTTKAADALLQYRGLGDQFQWIDPESGQSTTDEVVATRKKDGIDTVDSVLPQDAAGCDHNKPPADEPGVYYVVNNMTYGASARSAVFLPLLEPFASLQLWRLGLFAQMLVISLISTIIAIGGVFVIDKITQRSRNKKG